MFQQIAITGTNGKSSAMHMVKECFRVLTKSYAYIGTLGAYINDKKLNLGLPELTTYEPKRFYDFLTLCKNRNIENVIFEATSHGLIQDRIRHADIDTAAITNLTHDHLDYHKTFEHYKAAKLLLFSKYLKKRPYSLAILNMDDPSYADFDNTCKENQHRTCTFSLFNPNATLFVSFVTPYKNGIKFNLYHEQVFLSTVYLPYFGEFQISNFLLALLAFSKNNAHLIKQVLPYTPCFSQICGRMERIECGKKNVYVDFSHSPDALQHALINLRSLIDTRDTIAHQPSLWVVFGCGGDRDPLKRPFMGKIAHDFADYIVVTDDNPRKEDPKSIRRQILDACPHAVEIGKRADAIDYALSHMKDGDFLLIAGKGHEQVQIIGHERYPFSDQEVVKHYRDSDVMTRIAMSHKSNLRCSA